MFSNIYIYIYIYIYEKNSDYFYVNQIDKNIDENQLTL